MTSIVDRYTKAIEPILERTGDTPGSLAARLVGFGTAEYRAGLPKWGWFAVGLVAGGAAMFVYGDRIRSFVKNRKGGL